MAANIQIYTTSYCGFCTRAKALLTRKRIPFEEIDVTIDDDRRDWLVRETGRRTVPQIFIEGRPIGGYDELRDLEERGELDALAGTG